MLKIFKRFMKYILRKLNISFKMFFLYRHWVWSNWWFWCFCVWNHEQHRWSVWSNTEQTRCANNHTQMLRSSLAFLSLVLIQQCCTMNRSRDLLLRLGGLFGSSTFNQPVTSSTSSGFGFGAPSGGTSNSLFGSTNTGGGGLFSQQGNAFGANKPASFGSKFTVIHSLWR